MGEQVHVPVFEKGTQDPVKTALEAIEYARYYQRDVLIIDTAGRLHIDLELMDELVRIRGRGEAPGDPPGGGRHDRSGRGERGPDLQR